MSGFQQLLAALAAGGGGGGGGGGGSGWNPADKDADITLSGADLIASISAASGAVRSVYSQSSGVLSFEITTGGPDNVSIPGIGNASAPLSNYPGQDTNGWGYGFDGNKYNNTLAAFGAPYAAGAVIGFECDFSAGTINAWLNGIPQGELASGVSGALYAMWGPGTSGAGTRTATLNFGPSFTYMGGADQNSTWNPVDKSASVSLSGGDLVASVSGALASVKANKGNNSGVRRVQFTIGSGDGIVMVGLAPVASSNNFYPGYDSLSYSYYGNSGEKYNNNAGAAYGATYTAGDVIDVVYDAGAGTITFYKNGASQGVAFTSVSAKLFPMWGTATGGGGPRTVTINTGASAFTHAIGGTTAWG